MGFDASEDRLVLTTSISGDQASFLLTRRLTARFINGIAVVLERSSISASRAPNEMRSDIILLEHQGAITGVGNRLSPTKAPPVTEDRELAERARRLISNIKLKTKPKSFQLTLQAGSAAQAVVNLGRLDLHRFVEMLKRQSEKAGWNLQIEAGWLGNDEGQFTLN